MLKSESRFHSVSNNVKQHKKECKSVCKQVHNYSEHKSVTVSYLSDIGDEALGLKLLIDCYHASYVGVLHQLYHHENRIDIWLDKSCLAKTGQKLIGLIKVNYFDILEIKIVGVDIEAKKILLSNLQNCLSAHSLLMKRVVPIEVTDQASSDPAISVEDFLKDIHSHTNYEECESLDCIILDTFEDSFFKAMTFIRNESVIGICCEGIEMGRLGKFAWLGISTSRCMFMIDIAKLGMKSCLKEGLKVILTNKHQIKVIDDSRHLQDFLLHKHDCSLCNVFDVQASAIYLHMLTNEREVPCLLFSLTSLLHTYLEHPCDILAKYLTCVDDKSTWFERPLLNSLMNRLMYSVMFLRQLREKMISAMLVDLQQITSLFQNSQATKSLTAVNELDKSIVPFELQNLDQGNMHENRIFYARNKKSLRK